MPDDVASFHPGPAVWCARECLGHIIEAERRGFNGRIRTMLSTDKPDLTGWDQQAVARERRDCQRSTREVLEEFQAIRADSVRLVQGLSADDLEKSGTHDKVGNLEVRDLLQEWLHHDRNHFKQLQSNLQAFVWPVMGNTRLFSGE